MARKFITFDTHLGGSEIGFRLYQGTAQLRVGHRTFDITLADYERLVDDLTYDNIGYAHALYKEAFTSRVAY